MEKVGFYFLIVILFCLRISKNKNIFILLRMITPADFLVIIRILGNYLITELTYNSNN